MVRGEGIWDNDDEYFDVLAIFWKFLVELNLDTTMYGGKDLKSFWHINSIFFFTALLNSPIRNLSRQKRKQATYIVDFSPITTVELQNFMLSLANVNRR
jgi:hypothetical protein